MPPSAHSLFSTQDALRSEEEDQDQDDQRREELDSDEFLSDGHSLFRRLPGVRVLNQNRQFQELGARLKSRAFQAAPIDKSDQKYY